MYICTIYKIHGGPKNCSLFRCAAPYQIFGEAILRTCENLKTKFANFMLKITGKYKVPDSNISKYIALPASLPSGLNERK